jgi:hypothetical protein
MGVGPPEPPFRGRLQTAASCAGQEPVVVNVVEKALCKRQVRTEKANVGEPLMRCRESVMTSKPGPRLRPGRSLGDDLITAQTASGIEVARARSRLLVGTWEPVAPMLRGAGDRPGRARKEQPQAAGTVRGRVPRRGTGAGRPLVAVRPGNAGGAKGAGYPGLRAGQPSDGRSG